MVLGKYLLKTQVDAQVSGLHTLQPWYPAPQHPTAGCMASPLGSQCVLLPKHPSLVHFSLLHIEFLYIQDVTAGAQMIHEPHQKSLRCTSAVAHQSAQEYRLRTGLHPEAHLPKCLCPAGCPATRPRSAPHVVSPPQKLRVCTRCLSSPPYLPTGCPSPNSTPRHTKLCSPHRVPMTQGVK